MTDVRHAALRGAITRTQTIILAWLEQHGAGNPDELCDAAIELCEASAAVLLDLEQGTVHEPSAQVLYFYN